jgi:hypothetical protein
MRSRRSAAVRPRRPQSGIDVGQAHPRQI